MTCRYSQAGLTALIVLQVVMLSALYAGVAPHPPATTPLFAIGPFIGACIAAALAALWIGPMERVGRGLMVLAALGALVSFGPQKYLDAQIALIWPAVVSGQIAAAVVLWCAVLTRRMQAA
ncbi:MAG: hypothetical protein AAGI09_13570 [Pseudomonadota bacterium]